jgi:hypothetical protein
MARKALTIGSRFGEREKTKCYIASNEAEFGEVCGVGLRVQGPGFRVQGFASSQRTGMGVLNPKP